MYGAIDGLLLNVMPVLAVRQIWVAETDPSRRQRIIRGLLTLAASILVTTAYHLGYAEFHNTTLLMVVVFSHFMNPSQGRALGCN